MVSDHSLWCLTKPLEQGKIPKLVRPKHLEHLDRLVTDILHKVAHIPGDDADITRDVIKRPGGPLGGEDGDTGFTTDEEIPLVGVGVPMHLPQRAGLDNGVGGGDGLGDGEVLGVGDADLAARGLDGVLGEHLVAKVQLGLFDILAARALILNRTGVAPLEDVFLARGQVGKYLGVEVEVLGDDRLWRVGCGRRETLSVSKSPSTSGHKGDKPGSGARYMVELTQPVG